ncbi:ribosomal RNA-processing protein 8 isoform X2 [Macrosteles quadrilineatus]|nr:ribosomal RNA-processing protein 8 isoform X2 [Macrosteles quadrilineatus]
MGKVKPSILTGLFSHLSVSKKQKSKYQDLKHVSPKSKLSSPKTKTTQRKKGKKIVTTLSTAMLKNSKGNNEALLTPSTSYTPNKAMIKHKLNLKTSVHKIIANPKNYLLNVSTNQYNKITDSPSPSITTTPVGKREKFKNSKACSLRERMLKRLKAAKFRYMNEQLYNAESKGAEKMFSEDPSAFKAYHEGYRQQVARWPINPVDIIIKSLKKRAKSGDLVVADFGCGEAKLAEALPCTVHSLDLVSLNPQVTVCDMSRTPLGDASCDVVVFCLSLMGTNLVDYMREANRVLKEKGIMKIAEIESRFEDLNQFIHGVERMGFEAVSQDLSHNLFYFLDFKKNSNTSKKKKKRNIPELTLKPCLYKKR